MKKVVGLLVISFTAVFLPAVQANEKAAIAIIDTAVDTTKVNIAYEVCIMEEKRCPNKKAFMEGPGSATIINPVNGFEHGTNMASIAQKINPNMNIIFIRIVPATNKGTLGIYTDNTINEAIKWVIANKTKFNIVATSISFGSHNFKKSGAEYCPVTKNSQELRKNIVVLQNLGTATAFAAGNKYDKSRVDYPACIAEAVAVGSIGERGNIENYSNAGTELDFYALGTHDISGNRIMGTSAATAALAAYWAKSYQGSYQTTYDYIKSLATDFVVSVG